TGQGVTVSSLSMDYGRRRVEAVTRGVGIDANLLRAVSEPYAATVVSLTPTGRRKPLAITQTHWTLEVGSAGIVGDGGRLGKANDASRTPTQRRPLTLYELPA